MFESDSDIKVILLGELGVGKTALLTRFIGDTTPLATIGITRLTKTVVLDEDRSVALGLWDTGGQEKFDLLLSHYGKDAGCAIVTFDLTSRESLGHVDKWIKKLHKSAPDPNCFIVLVGTKSDLVSPNSTKVSMDDIEETMNKYGIESFFKTSARIGYNVRQVFEKVAEQYLDQRRDADSPLRERSGSTTVNLRQHEQHGPRAEHWGYC